MSRILSTDSYKMERRRLVNIMYFIEYNVLYRSFNVNCYTLNNQRVT